MFNFKLNIKLLSNYKVYKIDGIYNCLSKQYYSNYSIHKMIKFPSNQINFNQIKFCFFFLICKKSRYYVCKKDTQDYAWILSIADLADDVTRGHVEERNGEVIPGDSRLRREIRRQEESKTRQIPGLRRHRIVLFLFFFSRIVRIDRILPYCRNAESLIWRDNKKDDEPSLEDDGASYIRREPRSRSLQRRIHSRNTFK